MQHCLLITLIVTAIISLLHAEDKPLYTYQGEVAGVVCSACSAHVKGALLKLDGVKEVKIRVGKEGSVPKLEITSTSSSITTEAANKALGEDGTMYQIRDLKLQGK